MLVFTRLFPYQLTTIGRDLHKSRKITTHFDTKIQSFDKNILQSWVYKKYYQVLFEIWVKFRNTLLQTNLNSLEKNINKIFVRSFAQLTDKKHRIVVKTSAKKVEWLFPLKYHNLDPCGKIYKATCSRGNTQIGDTIRNVKDGWSEQNFADNKSEPVSILLQT